MLVSGGQRGLRPSRNATDPGGPRRRAISAPPVPNSLPGLPPACGRQRRPPAGSMPRSGRSPPGAAGRRDPFGASRAPSAASPAREARAAAGRHRRGPAGPPRGPAKRGRRVSRGRLPRRAAARRASGRIAGTRGRAAVRQKLRPSGPDCRPNSAAREVSAGRQRGPKLPGRECFVSRRPARRAAPGRRFPRRARFPRPGRGRRRLRASLITRAAPRVAARPAPGAPPARPAPGRRAAGSASRPAIRARGPPGRRSAGSPPARVLRAAPARPRAAPISRAFPGALRPPALPDRALDPPADQEAAARFRGRRGWKNRPPAARSQRGAVFMQRGRAPGTRSAPPAPQARIRISGVVFAPAAGGYATSCCARRQTLNRAGRRRLPVWRAARGPARYSSGTREGTR